VISKSPTFFVVKGFTGICDFKISGKRIEHEDYYFENMLRMEGDVNNGL